MNSVSTFEVRPLLLLVAEDHPVSQLLLQGQLHKLGMEVDIVENGQLAYELYQKNHYDAILSDCHMPVMDGYALARKVSGKQQGKRPWLIAVTADEQEGSLEKCLDAGFDDYLPKPCTLEELAKKLKLVPRRAVP